MSRYSVDTDALRSAAGRCDGISSDIGNLARQIQNVKNSLSFDTGRYGGVVSALNTCISNSTKCKTSVSWYGIYGNSIANKYSNTEDKVYGNISANKFDEQFNPNSGGGISGGGNGGGGGGAWNPGAISPFDWWKLIRKSVFGGTGATGSVLNLLYDGFVEKKPEKYIPDLIKLVGKVAKAHDGSYTKWAKEIFKIAEYDPSKYTLGGAFKTKFWDFSSTGAKISTACNWIAEGVASVISNAQEFAGGSQPFWAQGDFWTESITEMALNIGEGAIMTSVAGATVGALLVAAGAPAIATTVAVTAAAAGLAVAVDWGVNGIIQWVTGNPDADWKEAVSGLACDAVHAVGDAAKAVGKTVADGAKVVGEAAKEVGKAVSDAANEVGKAVGEAANSVGKAVSGAFGSICNWGRMAFA